MDSNHKPYDYGASFNRLNIILDTPSTQYEEVNSLPDRDKLTFTNGFYANCSALFVDIRNSSELPKKYKRPALAKLYRAFISEVVAILNGATACREINIVGDCVWAVYNTPYKADINTVFSLGAEVSSLIDVLNCKSAKRDYDPIAVGIGMSWGRALMIKAGYAGSGINDVVYMGDVVNEAAKLASHGNETHADKETMVSNNFRSNLARRTRPYSRRTGHVTATTGTWSTSR